MPAFLAGLAALLILVFGARLLATANPQTLALVLRKGVGVALLLIALFLIARGALPLAIPLAFFGLALLGMKTGSWFGAGGPFGSADKSPGQKSEVRTDALEMALDHDSGHMEGRILKGQFAGKTLSSLSDEDLLVLLEELRGFDEQGTVLIEAYLTGAPLASPKTPPGIDLGSRRAHVAHDWEEALRCWGLPKGRTKMKFAPRIAS
jgi:hypothetical protein